MVFFVYPIFLIFKDNLIDLISLTILCLLYEHMYLVIKLIHVFKQLKNYENKFISTKINKQINWTQYIKRSWYTNTKIDTNFVI